MLSKRSFPFLNAIFFGAFNDNFLKNGMIVWLTFYLYQKIQFDLTFYITMISGLFMLPFLFFSGTGGIIGERIEKTKIIRFLKLIEFVISLASFFAFYFESLTLFLIITFMMGLQSAIFAPVKFSILPQHFKTNELIKINGYANLATFVAILLGSLFGSYIILFDFGLVLLIGTLCLFSFYSFIISYYIPHSPCSNNPKINNLSYFNFFQHNFHVLKVIKNKELFQMVLWSSWFWFIGATIFSQLSIIVEIYLKSDNQTYIFFLALFTIGIALGSLFSSVLYKHIIHFKYHKIYLLIFTFSFLDAGYLLSQYIQIQTETILFKFLIQEFNFHRIIFDFFLIAFFGGCYIVPIYSFLQNKSKKNEKSLIFGANSIINALYMFASAILIIVLSKFNFGLDIVFYVISFINIIMFALFKKK